MNEPVTEHVDDRFTIELQDQKITLPLIVLDSLIAKLQSLSQDIAQEKTVKMRYDVQGDDKKVVPLGEMSDYEFETMLHPAMAVAKPVGNSDPF